MTSFQGLLRVELVKLLAMSIKHKHMSWYIDPVDLASVLDLSYQGRLHLKEIQNGFLLSWFMKGQCVNTWAIGTPSLYEARAQAMSIVHDALRETARSLVQSLPVIAISGIMPDSITGCSPKPLPTCPPPSCVECGCSKPQPLYGLR